MTLTIACWALVGAARAQPVIHEGRSAGTCSDTTLVCVVLKNGTSRPSGECAARTLDAVRILPGDCFDPD